METVGLRGAEFFWWLILGAVDIRCVYWEEWAASTCDGWARDSLRMRWLEIAGSGRKGSARWHQRQHVRNCSRLSTEQRARLERWFATRTPEELERPVTPSEVEGGEMWRAKDHLAHAVGVERYLQGVVKRTLAGVDDPAGFYTQVGSLEREGVMRAINQANERSYAKYRDESLASLLTKLGETRQATLALLASLSEEQLAAVLATFAVWPGDGAGLVPADGAARWPACGLADGGDELSGEGRRGHEWPAHGGRGHEWPATGRGHEWPRTGRAVETAPGGRRRAA